MRIKSKTDVITNSSTEVFLLKENLDKTAEEINALYPEFKGILKKYEDLEDWEKEELSETVIDPNEKGDSWYYLYRSYLFEPKKLTPDFVVDGRKYFLTEEKDVLPIQKKFSREVLRKFPEVRGDLEFLRDPEENFYRIFDGRYILLARHHEEIQEWIDNNISEFPPYPVLLEVYRMKDIKDVKGFWIGMAEDTLCITPPESINYETFRL